MRLGLALGLCSVLCLGQGKPEPHLRVWSREILSRSADPLNGDAPMAVGSLQKPFVAKAWAASHPGQDSPRLLCTSASQCWHRGGHGELGLGRALSVSCNAYFRRLAAETPLKTLRETLAGEGFLGVPSGPDAAIGLPGASPLVIRPSRLLEAYARLVREPWEAHENLRQQVLAGLRAAARAGTAAALGQGGCWAKTGTVPAADGNPSGTRGLVVVLDDANRSTLAELTPGTGREAAAALGRRLRWSSQGASPASEAALRTVVVRLFDLLPGRSWNVRNLGPTPIPARSGFLGSGAILELGAEGWVGPGLLEIDVPDTGLVRRLEGRLAVARDASGTRILLAALTPREYLSGVIAAELPTSDEERRVTLGAAILRFLAKGPRHGEADVCDSTHCAWFMGRGPRLTWATPRLATRPPVAREAPPSLVSDAEWSAMVARSQRAGPSQWSTDCGGAPLSSHQLWGDGNHAVFPCPRHTTATQPWQRLWKPSDLAKAFGGPVASLELRRPDGVWTLAVTTPKGTREYRFDEAHRRLASILGWDALPSPADEIQALAEGFQARGVGLGHRVGLCLRD